MHDGHSTNSKPFQAWLFALLFAVAPVRAWFDQRPMDPLAEAAGCGHRPTAAAVFGLGSVAVAGPAAWLGWERRFGLRELDALAVALALPTRVGCLAIGASQTGREFWREQLAVAAISMEPQEALSWRAGLELRRASVEELRLQGVLLVAGARLRAGALSIGGSLRLPVAGDFARDPEGGLALSIRLPGTWRLVWREERTSTGEGLGQLALAAEQRGIEWALAWLDGRGARLGLGWKSGPLRVACSLWWHPRLPVSRRFGLDLQASGLRS